MKHVKISAREDDWTVLAGTGRSQAAMMTIEPGDSEGGPMNLHDRGDQWLFVLSGTGRAEVAGETVLLGPGSLLLVERGESHEIFNDGSEPLRTVNIYAPPEYGPDGQEIDPPAP